jgi:ABC-type transport system involved in multi-copper enzyme maturation permease subunit
MSNLIAIAHLECLSVVRLKWIRVLTASFALLAAASAYAAGAAAELSGSDGFARTTLALIPVALILVPLAAVILGVSGQSREPGGAPFLFTQPVGRAAVVLGRWAGEVVALASSVTTGFGIGSLVVIVGNGAEGVLGYAFFVLATVALGAIFLSLAAVIAAATEARAVALATGTFVWFFFVLLYDGAALSVAGWSGGPAGARVLFASVLANPVDLIRVLMLSLPEARDVLGAAGEAWIRFMGGDLSAWLIATAVLLSWMLVPLIAAAAVLDRRDL